MIHRISIAGRLAAMIAITGAVVFGSVAMLLYHVLDEAVRNQIRGELTLQHTLLDPLLSSRDSLDDWGVVHTKLNGMQENGRIRYWILSDDSRWRHGATPRLQQDEALRDEVVQTMHDSSDRIWCMLSRTIEARGQRPDVRFVVALDSTSYLHTRDRFMYMMRVACGTGILMVAILGYWITRLGLSPVRRLSRQANALPPHDPTQRLAVGNAPAEIRELGVSINHSLERREAAWRQLEGFNADVAHELRTPLTNLIGQTQVALSQPRQADELQDLLASNLEELERMSGIVNDMLFLSSAENGTRAAELSDISLREEAEKTVEYLEDSFSERRMQVVLRGDAQVCADRRLFHRALANLLSNSARYADAPSTVTVAIARDGDHATVQVSDHGDAIPAEQQARLFERFYRADAARTRSGAHHGLGLSIVRAIARMHGGDVFVSSENGVNTFGFRMLLKP
ncbi:heavy metal sensor histidine kinase [Bordetella genomosp. 13]|uniref:heavy metal sensor histidine kinase n=1 Tax=Bordetella genomosp. 13 TaxID=463040 RepID=UPI0011A32302|nr:heavy metal sensor histidine kinase [Bordetella genomosp. 13]